MRVCDFSFHPFLPSWAVECCSIPPGRGRPLWPTKHSSSGAQTEQLRLFATQGRPLELSRVFTLCQRLVEETESVGEDGGGKLRSSRTATPTLLRRVNMQDAATHLLLRGLYFSIELRLELPSLPPTAYNQPSMATKSWVLLKIKRRKKMSIRNWIISLDLDSLPKNNFFCHFKPVRLSSVKHKRKYFE